MGRVLLDLRFALRSLRRNPLFTAVAVASLALGIGANTAIFTLMDQLMLRRLPVRDPQQLVMIWTTGPHMGSNRGSRAASYPMYQDYQQRGEAFSYVFCRYSTPLSVTYGQQTERVNAELVSGNFFQALGVKPALGRVLSPAEDDRVYKGHPVVVLGHQYWVERFAADKGVIGQKLLVNGYPMVIVGVSAEGFGGLDPSFAPRLRVPIQMKPLLTPGWDDLGNRRSQWIQMFARLKPGYTLDRAKATLQPVLSQILADEIQRPELRETTQYYRDRFLRRQVKMQPAATGYSQTRQSYSTALTALMCMVGLVLLIACFNVANLLVARAVARQKEIAIRLAMGASRGQLLAQLLAESVVLSLAGGAAGMLLSFAIVRGLLSLLPGDRTSLTLHASPDGRVLAFNLALAVLTGLLFGLAPALQALRVDLWSTLKDVVGSVTASRHPVILRKVMVTAQVALSFVLLAGAGLFVQTLHNLKNMNSGFRDLDNLVTFQVAPALNGYTVPRIREYYKHLLESIQNTPGVKAASHASVALLHGNEWDSTMSVEGHTAVDGEDMQAFMNSLAPGYWKTMGVPLLEGRDFDSRDEGEPTRVAIVNRKFARHYFGDKSPVGRHVAFGSRPKSLDIEIVGVAEDTLYEGPREGVRRQVFVADRQGRNPSSATFYVRTSLESSSLFNVLRKRVAEIDPAIPIYEMKTLDNQLDETLSSERLIAALSAAFGVLATALAALGLYGVMAYVVARRTREVGLRMALGASQGSVAWMVLQEALLVLALGLAVGVPVAYAASRYVSSQLFGVQAADVRIAALALAVLAASAIGACLLPARRASAIDPGRALRYE